MSISVKTRQWGNSLGIVIPRGIVEDLVLNSGEEVIVDITKKQNVLKELFGTIPFKKKTNQEGENK